MYIYFSLLFIFFQSTRLTRLPIHASCLSGHHAPSYTHLSIAPLRNFPSCAAALTITSWVVRLGSPQTTTSSSHFSFCPPTHHTVFLPCMEPTRL